MNRISSFSDIPGTVWKIGNQNEPVENDTSYVGANCWMQESPRIHGGSLDTAGHGGHDQQMLMNRSASEFAFEQFLKEHVSALLSKSNMKPSVAKNEDEKGKDATENEDVTGKDVETEDFTGKAVLYEDEKGKYGAAGVGHSEVIDLTEACLEKECSKEDVALFPNGVETSEQLQVSQALNPLFTGLPHQMPLNHTNPQAYENFLNQRLDLACAAVALTRSRGSFWGTTSGSLAVVNLEAEHSNYGCKDNTSISKIMSFPALVGIPALPPNRKIEGACSMTTRTTSGSSREQSDNECGTELSFSEQSIDPHEIKRMRKMLSNRESARRSRQRKQTHLTDLEMQVAELRVENFSLLKKLAEISQRFNEAAIDNRVLKSDVEALRAKVKVAEEIVARMTASPAVADPCQTMCNSTNVSSGLRNCLHVKYPSGLYNAYPNTRKVDPSMFTQPGEATSCENTSSSSANLGQESSEVQQLNVGTKMVRTCSMQRVASLEHLQKRLRPGMTCGSIWNGGWEMESPTIIGHGSVSEF